MVGSILNYKPNCHLDTWPNVFVTYMHKWMCVYLLPNSKNAWTCYNNIGVTIYSVCKDYCAKFIIDELDGVNYIVSGICNVPVNIKL